MTAGQTPTATYRLQFNAGFRFSDADAVTSYLHALGITHVYASSYLTAVPGSAHGYDVTDPTRLNDEIGDDTSYRRWIDGLRARKMGHILDLVPNHMGIAGSSNPWWQDVLENGPSSRFAPVFDIDWQPLKQELEHKVLLPILGASYGAVLERQEIALEYQGGAFRARYFSHLFPIAPGTYDQILTTGIDALFSEIGEENEEAVELLSIVTAIRHLPGRQVTEPALIAERVREKEVIKRRLGALTGRSRAVLAHVERAVRTFNGRAGVPESFDRLDALLGSQPYRLAHWRVAAEEINYRRFFDINELAAIRMEDAAVFDLVHAFVFELIERGMIDGLRIDHVDGLFDPGDYLRRLQARVTALRPDLYSAEHPLYVVVEKILGAGETLPDWPVEGTSGYDFLVMLNGLFIDSRHEHVLDEVYQSFTRVRVPYREIVYRGKQLILRVSMASELNVLAHRLNRFSEQSRHYRDFTLNSLGQAMREITACFPVYRTYVNAREAGVSARDRTYIERAVDEAKRRNTNRPWAVYDFIRDLLLKRAAIPEEGRPAHLRFVGQFQQVTSPVTAKGIEDTALYIYNRLVSLNEVGSEPDHFGVTPEALHTWLAQRNMDWPRALSTTSTHDTKRSEDVRARINVLSELPTAWRGAVTRWARLNRRARSIVDGQPYPSRNEEYLFYQTLVGSWPGEPMDARGEDTYAGRIAAYMQKAMREAKVFTSWINPSEPHEEAMARFVRAVLAPQNSTFRSDFTEFQSRVARFGVYNSLAQVAVKIAAPGVADFYQGTELWDFSLVDPDNRRPVDYSRRATLLAELDSIRQARGLPALARDLLARLSDDRLKLFVTTTMLRFRRERAGLFTGGAYMPLRGGGTHAAHVFGFARVAHDERAVMLVPRLVATLVGTTDVPPLGQQVWGDTTCEVPESAAGYQNLFTGTPVPTARDGERSIVRAADAFADFPLALLALP